MERDRRLDLVARTLFEMSAASLPISSAAYAETIWWHGIPEQPRARAVFAGPDEQRLLKEAGRWLESRSKTGDSRFGLALSTSDEGRVLTLVAGRSSLELDSVPRKVKLASTLRVAGRFGEDLRKISVAVTRPDGTALEPTVEHQGRRFECSFRVETRGIWQIEIIGHGSLGPTGLANFPVAVDTDICGTLVMRSHSLESRDPEVLSRYLYEAINSEREATGLEALEWSDELADVSSDYSQEMAASGVIAHFSPKSGSVADRTSAAGLRLSGVTENLARASSAVEVHRGLMRSPAHRANILHPNARRVGVGVSVVQEGDEVSMVVTQVFELAGDPIDPAVWRDDLARMINSRRLEQGLAALEIHPWLEETARSASADCFGGGEAPPIALEPGSFRSLSKQRYVTNNLLAVVDAVEKSSSNNDTAMGIHVLQGKDPDLGEGMVCVTVLLGRP